MSLRQFFGQNILPQARALAGVRERIEKEVSLDNLESRLAALLRSRAENKEFLTVLSLLPSGGNMGQGEVVYESDGKQFKVSFSQDGSGALSLGDNPVQGVWETVYEEIAPVAPGNATTGILASPEASQSFPEGFSSDEVKSRLKKALEKRLFLAYMSGEVSDNLGKLSPVDSVSVEEVYPDTVIYSINRGEMVPAVENVLSNTVPLVMEIHSLFAERYAMNGEVILFLGEPEPVKSKSQYVDEQGNIPFPMTGTFVFGSLDELKTKISTALKERMSLLSKTMGRDLTESCFVADLFPAFFVYYMGGGTIGNPSGYFAEAYSVDLDGAVELDGDAVTVFNRTLYQTPNGRIAIAKGGPGSGNFGHEGRPGERGGSSSEGGGGSESGKSGVSASGSRGGYDPERAKDIALKALEKVESPREKEEGKTALEAVQRHLSNPNRNEKDDSLLSTWAGELLRFTGWNEGDPIPYGMPDVPASVRGTRNDPTSPEYGDGLSEPLTPDERFATLGGQYGSFDKPEDWDSEIKGNARAILEGFMDDGESNGGDILDLEVSGYLTPGQKQTWDEPGYGPEADDVTFQTRDKQGRYYSGHLPEKYIDAFIESVEVDAKPYRRAARPYRPGEAKLFRRRSY